MLAELLAVAAALSAALLVYVFRVIVANYLAIKKFRKESPRIPIAPDRNIFSNHYGLVYGFEALKKYGEYHHELGSTFAAFIGDKTFVATTDLDFMERMVLKDPDAHINRCRPLAPLPEYKQDNLVFLFDEQWRRVRRVYASALSAHKIKSISVQSKFASVLDRFLDALEWRLGEGAAESVEIDLDDLCARWSFDLTFTSFFSRPDIIDYKSHEDRWVRMIDNTVRVMKDSSLAHVMAFPIFHPVIEWLSRFHQAGRVRNLLFNMAKRQAPDSFGGLESIEEIELSSNGASNLEKVGRGTIAEFITEKLHNGSLTEGEYLHTTQFFMVAAGRTTADVMTSIIFYLAKHPAVQEKLRAAILREGARSEYLDWVIHESIRLMPPVNSCTRTLAHDMHTSDGRLVAKGTVVTAVAYVVHRLKEYWGDDAEEFRPERWADAKSFHPCQFLGFGLGKRNCPGSKFALEGIRMVLDAMLRRYKFEGSAKCDELNVISAPILVTLIFERPTYVSISRLSGAE